MSLDGAFDNLGAERFGVELRSPYRDWSLVQFVLSLPVHYFAGPGRRKWLTRQALGDRLPVDWLNRGKSGSLAPLLRLGAARSVDAVVPRSPEVLEDLAHWIRPKYLRQAAQNALERPVDNLALACQIWGYSEWRIHCTAS
jgi:hypothetical protein